MKEKLEELQNKILESWKETEKKNKIKYIAGIIAFIIIITVAILVLTTPKYETLYGNMPIEDIGEVTGKLDELNISWKVDEKSNSILVPKSDKTRAKIELASEGIPTSGYNFMDAFNDSSWTMTDYDKKQRMKQALQSELANTISEIDGIKSAKVYIAEKEKTNFVLNDQESESTASVFLVKDARNNLTNEKIMAIKNLVAGSISTSPDNVIITDSEYGLLDGNSKDDITSDSQFRIVQNLEVKINNSIRNFLANIYGYENVDVLSSVKINLDSEKRTEKIFSPPIEGNEEGMVRSTEEMEEEYVEDLARGVPGERENTEDDEMPDEPRSRSSRASKIINNEINEINREINKTPGQVESITVAVLINEKSLPEGELTIEKSEEISNLIYAATGLDTKNVKVIAEEFSDREMSEGEAKELSKKSLVLYFIGLILLLIIGFIVYKLIRKKKDEELVQEEIQQMIQDNKLDSEDDIEDIDFELEESKMKKQINKFIEERPDAVVQLLRNWLNE